MPDIYIYKYKYKYKYDIMLQRNLHLRLVIVLSVLSAFSWRRRDLHHWATSLTQPVNRQARSRVDSGRTQLSVDALEMR